MLEENNKRKILEILQEEFPLQEEIHMAKVGKYLHEKGVGPDAFGYKKMKKYLLDLKGIMTLQERMMNGVPQTIIMLHEYEDQNVPHYSDLQMEKQDIIKKEEKKEETEEPAGKYPRCIQDFAFIPNKVLGHLERMASVVSMEGRSAIEVLEEAYDRAVEEESFEISEDHILLYTGVYTDKQEPLYAVLSPNKIATDHKWALTYIHTTNKKQKKTKTKPKEPEHSLLDRDVLLPDKTVNLLKRFVKDGVLKGRSPKEVIISAYDRAYRAGEVYEEDEMFAFPLYLQSLRGEALNAVCRINRYPNQQKWALTYIGSDDIKRPVQPRQRRSVPGNKLEKFAEIGNWRQVLEELASMALPEQWDFAGESEKSYYILRQYLCYTFYRLEKEDKVCISAGEDFAAFNTGLVSRMYEDIYACFVPNEEDTAKWKWDGFCVAGERGNGKLLVKYFSPLPQAARYFKELKDLLYDTERQLIADYNHILIENIDRLPMDFIIQECFSDKKAVQLAKKAGEENNVQKRRRICKELAEYISEQPRLVTRLRNRLDDAIELAIKQCRWNYKTALPLYYPKGNCMSLMLPLSLQDDEKVDVAFVVQLTESGNYQGQTILTLAQAYLDARLLCRLNNEWLNTEKVIGLMDLEDPDDIGTMMEY